nr:hypothetical protein [Actinoplanes sp. DH11]
MNATSSSTPAACCSRQWCTRRRCSNAPAPDWTAFEPRHTVHGFRYARFSRDPGDVVMRVVHTDLRRTATFTCGDDDLNRLHEVADRSFRGNAVDIPTGCPTRERLGWTGDYQVFVPTAARLYDVDGFGRKWLRSVRDDQLADGRIVNTSPDHARLEVIDNPEADHITGSAGWGDAIVHVPWVLWEIYGDRQVLAENLDAMTRWVAWALGRARDAHHPSRSPSPFVWDGCFHWGEWLEPGDRGPAGDPMAWFMADKGEVGTAYLCRSVRTLAAIHDVLGRTSRTERYAGLADQIRDAWQAEFLDTGMRTQAGCVRALAFDLVPEHRRAEIADRLVTLIRDAGWHLGTGFLSTADLLPVLADVAYRLLFQRTTPSWLGMLDGAPPPSGSSGTASTPTATPRRRSTTTARARSSGSCTPTPSVCARRPARSPGNGSWSHRCRTRGWAGPGEASTARRAPSR